MVWVLVVVLALSCRTARSSNQRRQEFIENKTVHVSQLGVENAQVMDEVCS